MIRIDVESFKQCFKEKEGVVINTFHGVKGEEYTTVIAFGLLYGYVPHWNIINNKPLRYQTDETKKLLYVVCSRAKKNLYLFSEQGRTTKKGWELPPTKEIESVAYMYDDLEMRCVFMKRLMIILILKILRWMKTEEMQTAFISLMENIRIILADQKIRCI